MTPYGVYLHIVTDQLRNALAKPTPKPRMPTNMTREELEKVRDVLIDAVDLARWGMTMALYSPRARHQAEADHGNAVEALEIVNRELEAMQ